MIKSELVQKIAEKNPHLYHRDIERIVNTVLDEIIAKEKEARKALLDPQNDGPETVCVMTGTTFQPKSVLMFDRETGKPVLFERGPAHIVGTQRIYM